eukprot:c19907_g1_i1 orf=414-2780(-)
MRESHISSTGNPFDPKPHSHFGPADQFTPMEPQTHAFHGFKRMRLISGGVAGTAGMWDLSRLGHEDDCRLGLGIGPAECTTNFDRTSSIDNQFSVGDPLLVTSSMHPSSTSSINLSQPVAHTDGGAGLGRAINRGLSTGSWISTDSICIEEPERNVSPAVELGLGLNTMPVISGADSVLTSVYPMSINQMDASGFMNPDQGSSLSFLCHEGGSHISYNADVPMIDEGSTSNGNYILPFLQSHRIAQIPSTDAQRFESSFVAVPESVAETDVYMSFKASSGTTSTSGTSSGVGDRAPKMCRFTGCRKRARGASGLCISHGGGRRCQRLGCNKGAEGSTVFCKAHGGGRRCEHLGCTKSAEGKTDFCIAHGGGSRCCHDGCSKAARGRTGFCIRHGGGKRCQREGCSKSAEGYSSLCIAHGGGKRCQYPNCGKGAQGSTMLCKGHGGGKRCIVEGCNKGAEGSTSLCKGHGGGKRCQFDGGGVCTKSVHGGTSFCVAHGGGKRCAVEGCTKSARGRTDCCVKHGGGKRCKFENCDKSAQGSTDFCKAHGGGKRCIWGQEGSIGTGGNIMKNVLNCLEGSCDRYAKGKLGLCAEHSALVQDQRVHGIGTFEDTLLSRIEGGFLHEEMPSASDREENFLSSFNASKSVVQAMEDSSEGAEFILQASSSSGAFGLEGNRMQDNAFCLSSQLPLLPSMLGVHSNKSYTSDFAANFAMQKLSSSPGYTLQPSISPQTFGFRPAQWHAFGKQEERGQAGPSNNEDDGIFNMSSLSLPEERVHGGNIMALLSRNPSK